MDYRFATAPYANTAPLARYIPRAHPLARLVPGSPTPAALAARVLAGEVDAALIPVADLFAQPTLRAIAGLGVCAAERARSVLLKCRRPLARVRRVAPDPASRTSNALAAILLRDYLRRDVRWVAPKAAPTADAAVVIGDRALILPPAPAGDCDLAALWRTLTGLPFVFAVWAHRRDHPRARILARIAHQAYRLARTEMPALAQREARRLRLPSAVMRAYLTESIHYTVGPRERQALRLFRARWAALAPEMKWP